MVVSILPKSLTMNCLILLIIFGSLISQSFTILEVNPISTETKSIWLDNHSSFRFSWTINESNSSIKIKIEIKARSWVAVGWSPDGRLENSDLIIASFDPKGKPSLMDCHIGSDGILHEDASKDVRLIHGHQNGTHSVIQLFRYLVTCDDKGDIPIDEESMKIVWAIGKSSHFRSSTNGVPKIASLFVKFGWKSMRLVNYMPSSKGIIDNEDVLMEVVNMPEFDLTPNKSSYMYTKLLKVGSSEKRHGIMFEPILPEGKERFIHRVILFACSESDPHKMDPLVKQEGLEWSFQGSDFNDRMDYRNILFGCHKTILLYVSGHGRTVLPKDAGFIWGGNESSYVRLEVHLNNNNLEYEKISSGFNVWSTSRLRPNHASSMVIGSSLNWKNFIPPVMKKMRHSFHCPPSCLEKFVPESGLTIYGIHLHGQVDTYIKLRHFRGNKELPSPVIERSFNEQYQTIKFLRMPVKYLKGDILTTECEANSLDLKKVTLGGALTTDDMCIATLYFYPMMEHEYPCLSGYNPSIVSSLFGIDKLKPDSSSGDSITFLPEDPFISTPQQLSNLTISSFLTEKKDWDEQLIEKTYGMLHHSKRVPICMQKQLVKTKPIGYPKLEKEWSPVVPKCNRLTPVNVEEKST